jgi:hypothetical protein
MKVISHYLQPAQQEILMEPMGKTISPEGDESTIDLDHVSTNSDNFYPLYVNFMFRDVSKPKLPVLPKLRFGMSYQFRIRVTDMAGNSLSVQDSHPVNPPSASASYVFPPSPSKSQYLRYEPVSAPTILLLEEISSPGDSVEDIIIRTYNDQSTETCNSSRSNDNNYRWIIPPKTSIDTAEKHGIFDGIRKSVQSRENFESDLKKAYEYIAEKKDGSFDKTCYPDELVIPYIHDPVIKGVNFTTLPNSNTKEFLFEFPQNYDWDLWTERKAFKIELKKFDPDDVHGNQPISTGDKLVVKLEPGEVIQVKMSCYFEPGRETEFALYNLAKQYDRLKFDSMKKLIESGSHWMLTPYKLIKFIHAVQKPLQAFDSDAISIRDRQLGDTHIVLEFSEVPICGKSTQKIVFNAETDEIFTSELVKDGIKRVMVHKELHNSIAFEIPVDKKATMLTDSNKHEFHDTKHRIVSYTVSAVSRFKDYFNGNCDTTLNSKTTRNFSIANTVRPQSPSLLYLIPLYKRSFTERIVEGKRVRESMKTTGIRAYFDKPFDSSGLNERLGIVILNYGSNVPEAEHRLSLNGEAERFVTQISLDPTSDVKSQTAQSLFPTMDSFLGYEFPKTTQDQNKHFSIEELKDYKEGGTKIDVLGYSVNFDSDLALWYCDIGMNHGSLVSPFIRFKFASFQEISVENAHLSRIVFADYIRISPRRTVSVIFSRTIGEIRLSVSGFADLAKIRSGLLVMRATIEERVNGTNTWIQRNVNDLEVKVGQDPDMPVTWHRDLEITANESHHRILIEELEQYCDTYDENGHCTAWKFILKSSDHVSLN